MNFYLTVLLVLLLVLPIVPSVSSFPQPYDKYVNDFSSFFSPSQVSDIRAMLAYVETNTTAEVVLVTVNTTSPQAIQQYATDLFNDWKVGKSDKNNGLLVLYSVQENKIWATTGYGLEGVLPDSKIGRFLDDYYVPLRDQNRTQEGIASFLEAVGIELIKNREEIISGKKPNQGAASFFFENFFFFLFFFLLILSIFSRIKKGKRKNSDMPWWMWIPLFLPGRSSGSGFGGSSGFGGGGFGGGFSGGGGAGR